MIDKDKIKSAVKNSLDKGRTYIDDPSAAPEWANVEEGERGGYYYESTDSIDDAEMERLSEDLANTSDLADDISSPENYSFVSAPEEVPEGARQEYNSVVEVLDDVESITQSLAEGNIDSNDASEYFQYVGEALQDMSRTPEAKDNGDSDALYQMSENLQRLAEEGLGEGSAYPADEGARWD